MSTMTAKPTTIEQGGRVRLEARLEPENRISRARWELPGRRRPVEKTYPGAGQPVADLVWHVPEGFTPGTYEIRAVLTPVAAPGGRRRDPRNDVEVAEDVTVTARPFASGDAVSVTLRRADTVDTDDVALWIAIRNGTRRLSFNRYQAFVDPFLCRTAQGGDRRDLRKLQRLRGLPFPDMEHYRVLKNATEVFMMANCGVRVDEDRLRAPFQGVDLAEERVRLDRAGTDDDPFRAEILERWRHYISADGDSPRVPGEEDDAYLPYLAVIRLKLGELDLVGDRKLGLACYGLLQSRLTNPCLIELIWTYWHREGHLAHAVNALIRRFQNIRAGRGPDPLAHLQTDPIRPLGSLLWGMVNDEQHWLTDTRLAYELAHHYGITPLLPSGSALRPADSRVQFLESFHTLLHVVSEFYLQDDNTTVLADPFRVLNSLKEVHLQLTSGQGNQYLDLPWQARQEDLMRQYVLARPEIREFLPSRIMVALPERWMDAVETIKSLYGWADPPITHFRDLADFGEQLLLGIRYGNWNSVQQPQQAANWARYWRAELQGYIHAYAAVTGVDLTAEPVDATMPSVLVRQRLLERLADHGVRPRSPVPAIPAATPRAVAPPSRMPGATVPRLPAHRDVF